MMAMENVSAATPAVWCLMVLMTPLLMLPHRPRSDVTAIHSSRLPSRVGGTFS